MLINLKRMKAEREYANLSQEDMAKKLKISTNAYWRYETGKRNISAELLGAFAKVLGIKGKDMHIFFSFNIPNRGNKKIDPREIDRIIQNNK